MNEFLPEIILLEHHQRVHWIEMHAWKFQDAPRRSWRLAIAAALHALAIWIAPQVEESPAPVSVVTQ